MQDPAQHPIHDIGNLGNIEDVSHRPWPPPSRSWVMVQVWHDLCFAHWPVAPERIRPLLPKGLELDTFDGSAWVGVVPFRMSGIRLRGLPPVPGTSAFPELNVRTYVKTGGKPGVWFFSLDAANRLAVVTARATFRLPYFHARMSCEERDGRIIYESVRIHRDAPAARFRATYRPRGPIERAPMGSLDHWLTERYCLYAVRPSGKLLRGEIHHAPWPLQDAEASLIENTMADAALGELGSGPGDSLAPPQLRFARRLAVRIWSPEPV